MAWPRALRRWPPHYVWVGALLLALLAMLHAVSQPVRGDSVHTVPSARAHVPGVAQPVELYVRAGPAGQGIELEVRDHGPGVPEDQLPHLGQPFFRPDTARTRSAGGVGLGLYLCKLVAQAHGGTFAVRNAKPGLAVTVTLPGATPGSAL